MSAENRPIFVRGLTPLRGIAALLVVFMHYNLFIAAVAPTDKYPVVEKLTLMVDFFFVLSGFVMRHNYGALFQQRLSGPALRAYLGARFARLYPLHIITFAIVFVIGSIAVANAWVPSPSSFFDDHAVIPQLLMVQAWGYPHEATWNTPSWSISIEFLLYLLFPLLVLGLARTGWIGRILFAGLLAASAAAILYHFQPAFWRERWRLNHVPDFVPYPIHTFDVITGPGAMLRGLYGFGIGLLLHEFWESRRAERLFGSVLLPIVAVATLVTLWQLKLILDPFAVLLLAVILLSVACPDSLAGRVLEMQPFRWLGDVSYSIYLVHLIPILGYIVWRGAHYQPDPLQSPAGLGFALPHDQALAGLVIVYAITLVLATLTNRLVEKPGRAWLRHAFGLGRPHPATPEQAGAADDDLAPEPPTGVNPVAATAP